MDSQDHKTTTKTTSDETAAAPAPDRGAARLEPDGSLLLTGLSLAPVPDRVEPAGVVFRGAPRAQPGPGMPYTITKRELVWADNLNDLGVRGLVPPGKVHQPDPSRVYRGGPLPLHADCR